MKILCLALCVALLGCASIRPKEESSNNPPIAVIEVRPSEKLDPKKVRAKRYDNAADTIFANFIR